MDLGEAERDQRPSAPFLFPGPGAVRACREVQRLQAQLSELQAQLSQKEQAGWLDHSYR